MARVLMCRPEYFAVKYAINVYMKRALRRSGGRNPVDLNKAVNQWLKLTSVLSLCGLELNFIAPEADWPDMVFTANAGLIYKKRIVLSSFRYPERQGEVQFFRKWFKDHGYETLAMPQDRFFEGDALFLGETLICGYGDFRTDEFGALTAAELLEKEPALLKLVDENYYHLDACFCFVGDNLALFYPYAFDVPSRRKIENLPAELIEVSSYDARRFVCNAVPIRKGFNQKLITMPMSKKLRARLEKRSIEITELELSEFMKSGGGARCLTLFM